MPDWDALRELAAAQDGYFASWQAAKLGFSSQLLYNHLQNRQLERAYRGIYRLSHYPLPDHTLVPVWLWTRCEGVFSHDTALYLHNLSDILPARVHITVPEGWSRPRPSAPLGVELYVATLAKGERTWRGNVPLTTPARSVLDFAAAGGDPELLRQAIMQGLTRQLFSLSDIAAALPVAAGQDTWIFRENLRKFGDSFRVYPMAGTYLEGIPANWLERARRLAKQLDAVLYTATCAGNHLSIDLARPMDVLPMEFQSQHSRVAKQIMEWE